MPVKGRLDPVRASMKQVADATPNVYGSSLASELASKKRKQAAEDARTTRYQGMSQAQMLKDKAVRQAAADAATRRRK